MYVKFNSYPVKSLVSACLLTDFLGPGAMSTELVKIGCSFLACHSASAKY